MRRRIYNLANGKFEYEKPELLLSTDRLELKVVEGQNYKGSFTIRSGNGLPLRGVIYTSDVRMECMNPQFEGEEVHIQFEFHSEGLMEGNIQKGEFYIICNQNEYNLSFVVNISKLYPKTSIGTIRSIYEFAKLVAKDKNEAYEIFTSPMFVNLIKEEEVRERMLYEGLCRPGAGMQDMEEFLIACKQKETVLLTMDEKSKEYCDITQSRKETLVLRKREWGYLELEITSDASFLHPVKKQMTTADFIGSMLQVEYLIEKEKLHAGKNYGKLTLKSPYQTLEHTVCVYQKEQREAVPEKREEHTELSKMKCRLTESYIRFRLKQMTLGEWVMGSNEILDHFIAAFPSEHWYGLMKAQVLLINRQRQEAEWILDEKKKTITDTKSVAWAYYLYLTTLLIREDSYADKVLKNVEDICRVHNKDMRLVWILLFLRGDYAKNAALKYYAIREQVMGGCTSPYFYLEAYLLLEKEPYIMTEMGEFECRLLLWACRKHAITKELAIQVTHLAGDLRTYEERVYKILCGCYEIYLQEELLTVICAYLIKGQKYDTLYHHWYEEGITADLRLAGLYEAFVYSMDAREVRQVPKMVQMYFRYHSSLPYAQKAALYVNIIANKESQPSVYASYERAMERFALEQILERHMDDNLAVIYDTFLTENMIQNETAKALGQLLFYHKLTCFDKDAVRLYVVHRQLKDGFSVSIQNGTAYFPIYSSDYVILLEDRKGNRYASGMEYQLEKLMRPGRFIKKCMEQAPECESFFIYQLDKKPFHEELDEKELELLRRFLRMDSVSEEYRTYLFPEIIRLHQVNQVNLDIREYLKRINPSMLNQSARKYMVELLVDRHAYREAYAWLQRYGIEEIDAVRLAAVAGSMAGKEEYADEEFLLYLCAEAFFGGKYDEAILKYLCENYDGSTKRLGEIWQAAKQFGIETYGLEEHILIQLLYSTEYMEYTEEIFESYCRNGGKEIIKDAYLNYFSQAYFVEHMVISERFFRHLVERPEEKQIPVCRLAILKYLATHKDKQEEYMKLSDTYLADFTAEKIYFSFYRRFPVFLQQKYGFYDKVFIEYQNRRGNRVFLHYRSGEHDEYRTMEMKEAYGGIFISDFLLFFGENIQYYVSQMREEKEQILESNQITGSMVCEEQDKSRYTLLNQLITQTILEEDIKKTKEMMIEYEEQQQLCKRLFEVL